MASAWGSSWGSAWGNAWGAISSAVTKGGAAQRRARKVWVVEIAGKLVQFDSYEAALAAFQKTKEKPAAKPVIVPVTAPAALQELQSIALAAIRALAAQRKALETVKELQAKNSFEKLLKLYLRWKAEEEEEEELEALLLFL
jgi:hypothetical protein